MEKIAQVRWLQNVHLRALCCAALVGLAAPFYFTPLEGDYRISVGALAMGILLLCANRAHTFEFCILCGLFTFMGRIVLTLALGHTFVDAWQNHGATLMFYLVYGVLLEVFLKKDEAPLRLLVKLMAADVLGNIAEAVCRAEVSHSIFAVICAAALLRASLSVGCYLLVSANHRYIVEKERQRRYDRLCLLLSQIRVENFYLQKTSTEIDRIMRLSFSLYDTHKQDAEVSEQALEISRSIHEVGKDARRVRQGLDALISAEERQNMSLEEIFSILEENTRHLLEPFGGRVAAAFKLEGSVRVGQCYGLLAVLNNLITNALDACGERGCVRVKGAVRGENAVFVVQDDGCGIDPELIAYIFDPGFTTKFDAETGKASTGIGLNHVQNVVRHMDGKISVDSAPGKGTAFTVTLPLRGLAEQNF